jgi:hypothetical protein
MQSVAAHGAVSDLTIADRAGRVQVAHAPINEDHVSLPILEQKMIWSILLPEEMAKR